jgi:NitT/TauT family transport system permease protein
MRLNAMAEIDKDQSELQRLSAGLDALESKSTQSDSFARKVFNFSGPLIAMALFIGIWQIFFYVKLVEEYILPSPQQVYQALVNQYQEGILLTAAWNSLSRGVQGFFFSIIIAIPIGLALGLSKTVRVVLKPITTGLQQLPSVAWVPAAIIWFGLSNATIYAVILLGAVPSIANGLSSGIEQIPSQYLKVGRVLGTTRIQQIRHIILPASFPGFLAGLEQGWAFAWRSLMAAELIAVSPALGVGLGQLLDVGRQLGDMSLVLGAILSIMFVGILIEKLAFAPIREHTLRIRGLRN